MTVGTEGLSVLSRRALSSAGIFAVIALALGLRLYGLNWDQGFSYTPHPDERAILAKVVEISPPTLGELGSLFDADESPWNPRWFPYGSFPLYLLKGVQLIYSLGPGEALTDLRLAGRVISALADVVTVAMIYVLGGRIYGRRVGLLASALVALAVIHIQLSHFFAVDTLLALITVVAAYFMYRVAKEGRLRDSILAGACIGLGLATKMSLAPIYAALLVAHMMYAFSMAGDAGPANRSFDDRWPGALRGLAAAVGVSLAVIFIVQPYTFLDWSTFYGDIIEQSEMVRRVRDYPYTRQYFDTTPYWYHVRQLATWSLGWPLGFVAWAGLLYVSVRGTRLNVALAYLAVGWGLPIAILLFSTSIFAIVGASAVAVAALLATLPFRSNSSRMDVLLLSWVTPYFLIIGAYEVKFLRYLIPITPFLLLFGSRALWALWDRSGVGVSRPLLRPLVAAVVVLVLGVTGYYALSYMAIYRQEHTAVRASQWITENVPRGSVILKEHWEEGLPNLSQYEIRELPLYDEDTPQKLRLLANELAEADYQVFFSNRLYGTIPRLPERYPSSAEYYRLMFSGRLGYELVDFQTAYPELLGVRLVDDTFGRPAVPEPDVLNAPDGGPLTLDLGFADESFSVYDHPKVLIFQNVERHDAETIRSAIEGATHLDISRETPMDGEVIGLMLSPQDAEAQRQGGTWTEIVRPGSWTSRLPVLAWLIVIEGIAVLALPLTFFVFRPLPDRGYLFSKVLGLLGVAFVVWLLASLRWMAFSRESISLALLLLAVASLLILARHRREMLEFVRKRWSVLLIGEVVFLLAFFAFVMVRMANPDLWHPFRGGEKPMDLAYLNAVLRSSFMPPYDPWFGGGYINYYYWGQFIVATLIRATGISPGVAYNLAVPMFFALTVSASYAIVYNLAEGTRRALTNRSLPFGVPSEGRPRTEGSEPYSVAPIGNPAEDDEGRSGGGRVTWSPVIAGVGGALFVSVLGNLDGAIQVAQGLWRAVAQGLPFGEFDFWRSTRMMPPDPPGHEITEFPFFTFLFADLHAHMMALPFTLLVLGLAIAVLTGASRRAAGGRGRAVEETIRLALLGLAVGSLRLLNTWDFPTYLLLSLTAVFLAEFFAHGGFGFPVVIRWALKSLFVLVVGFVAFLPFHLSFETSFETWYWPLEVTTNQTVLWQFLAISGLFVFILGSFFVHESRVWLAGVWREVTRGSAILVQTVSGEGDAGLVSGHRVGTGSILALVLGALIIGYVGAAVLFGTMGSTIPFVAVLLALVAVTGLRSLLGVRADALHLSFVAVVVAVALAIAIGLDIFRVEGDIDRMNSIFKFYLQIWVLLGLASAYLLWRMVHDRPVSVRRMAWGQRVWLVAVALLIASASVYPVMGTQDRLRDRFNGEVLPLTLDGTAYIRDAVYHDRVGDIDLAADYHGIVWLRDNVEGSPIVLEGVTPTYRWGSRISVYTGLPGVVGWQWHQEQQRWDYRSEVGRRIADVNKIYSTTDPQEALSLLQRYGVRYVYVGQLERLYYPGKGLRKFDEGLIDNLELVFQSNQVAIYRFRDEV